MPRCASRVLLLALLAVADAGADSDAFRSPMDEFREAEKKLKAGDLDRARALFQRITRAADERLRRLAFDRLLGITQRLELHAQTVEEGRRYRRLLNGRGDRVRQAEVTLLIGMSCEALAQYRLAEKELIAARPVLEEARSLMPRLVLLTRQARLGKVLHGPAEAGKRWKTAETAIRTYLDDPRARLSPSQRSECVWLLAECYFQQERHTDAIGRLNDLLASLEERDDAAGQVETLRLLAEHQEALARFADSAQSLRRAIPLYEKLPLRERLAEAELLDALGDALGKGRQPIEAEKTRAEAGRAYLDVLQGPAASKTSPFTRSRAFWKMQRLYQKTHQYQRALLLIDGVTGPGASNQIITTDPRFKAKQAAMHVFLGSYAQARGLFRDAVTTLEAGDPLNLIELPRALNSLAVVEQATNGLTQTESLGARCIDLYARHALPDDETLVETWNILGTNAALRGLFALGVQRFRDGAAVCKKLGRKGDRQLSSLLLNQALLYKAQGDLALATRHCREALTVYQRSEEPDGLGVALFQGALASLYAEQGGYAQAGRLAEGVLEQCRKFKIPAGPLVETAKHCRALGLMHERKDRQAEELWSEVRAAQEKSRQDLLLPRTLNYLGLLAELRGKDEEAMKNYRQADGIQEKQPRTIPTTRFVTLWRQAVVLDRQGRKSGARAALLRAIEMVEGVRQQTYGDAQQRTTFLAQFTPAFELAVEWALRDGQTEEAFDMASRGRSRAFLDQLLLAGADPRATLSGPAGENLRRKELALRERLTALRAQLGLLPAAAHNQETARRLVADLATAQTEFSEVWREILNASDVYRTLTDKAVVAHPLAILRKKALPAGTALLAYHLQRERAFVMLVSPGEQAPEVFPLQVPIGLLHELNKVLPSSSSLAENPVRRGLALRRRQVITGGTAAPATPGVTHVPLSQRLASLLVEHYRFLLEDPSFATLRGLKVVSRAAPGQKAVRGLPAYADVLLPAALRQRLLSLKPDALLVIPDGPLHKLPLEALVLKTDPRPTFVLDELPPLIYAPSVSALAYQADRPPLPAVRERSLLTVCNPAYPLAAEKTDVKGARLSALLTGALPRLPFTAEESRRIRRLFPADKVTVLEGEEATEKQVTLAMGKHSILHVAAHGFADERFGNLFGALALAPGRGGKTRADDDGFLALYEIYRLPLAGCELAVLSACETNVGPQQPLEAGVTLASAFLTAGAREVVASHWSVDDRSTAELMGAFFEEITAKSASPISHAQALQKARKRLRNRPETEAPFQWAPFVLIGTSAPGRR